MATFSHRWYPLKLPFSYRIYGNNDAVEFGTGETLAMSSAGVRVRLMGAFNAESQIVHLSIAWPMPLDGRVPIRLVITGKILRNESGTVEIRTEKYQFRTAGAVLKAGASR
jgi:hypothetical protein